MTSLHKRVALIYGDSILLAGISETLRTHNNLTVVTVKLLADPATLTNLNPDLILVDASQITPTQTEGLIAAFPEGHSPRIIRINMDSQQLTIVSTQQFPAANIEELEQALEMISKQ